MSKSIGTNQLVATKQRIEDPEDFSEFVNSIKANGILQPITVLSSADGYIVLDGHRRLKAAKQLRLGEVPCEVKTKLTDLEQSIYNLALNAFNKRLNDIEKAHGIAEAYELGGYTKEQAAQAVKHLDSEKTYTYKGSRPTRSFKPDAKFKEIFKRLGFPASTQYKYLQMILKIDPEILEYAENQKLDRNQKIMLSHTGLQKHPEIQKLVATKIRGRDTNQSKLIVHQTVRDLETGYIKQDAKGSYHFGAGEREILGKKTVETMGEYLLNIGGGYEELLKALTGQVLTRGQTYYTEEVIKNSHKHRVDLVKTIHESQVNAMQNMLEGIKEAVDDMLDVIVQERESREVKGKLLTP